MTHLMNHAAGRRRVFQLHRVPNPAQAEAAHHGQLIPVEPDRALDERHLHGSAFRVRTLIGHVFYALARVKSPSSLPRNRAIATGSLSDARPANVARTTL